MTSKLKIWDASGWTIFIFGLLAFLFGLFSLIRPELLLSALVFITAVLTGIALWQEKEDGYAL